MPNISKLNIDGTLADIKDSTARSDISAIKDTLVKVSTSSDGFAPKVTNTGAYLRGDGTWSVPTDTTYGTVTTKADGLMSSGDKTKLDGIETGANNYSLPVATSAVFGGVKTGSNITNTSGTISLTKGNVTDALGYTPPTTNTTYATATTAANGLMSSSDKTKLNEIATGAEVNQNAFSNITVGSVTVKADEKTDTLTLAGSNVTLTPNMDEDKITIGLTKDNVTSALGYTPPTTNTTYATATTSANGLMSSSDKTKLNGIEDGAQVNTITGIKGDSESSYRTGNVNITPANIGAVASSEKGAASGVVPLNASGVIDSTYLPSYVDDVLEYASKSDFPKTGESGKIYVDTSAEENNTYRWSGSTYILIAKNTNTTYKISKSGSTITLTGSDGSTTTVDDANTTYGTATTVANGLMSSSDKTKLNGIAENANNYSLPDATTSVKGGVKVGSNITVSSGTISLTKDNVTSALGYTPPTTNTTYATATTSANGLMSSSDKTKLTNVASGAEVNQNAFSNIIVGDTTIAADSKTDSFTLVGSNVTLTPDATNDKVTIGITKDDVTSALGYTPSGSDTTYNIVSTSANGLAPKVTSTSGFLKGDGTWATPTNTTYGTGTSAAAGLTKLYTGTGSNSDGTMTQNAINTALGEKANSSHTHTKSQITDFPTIPTVNNSTITFTQNGASKGSVTLNQSSASTVALSDTTYGTVSTSANGLAPKVTSTSGFLKGDGTWSTPTNTTYGTMSGATSAAAGKSGLVPAPASGKQSQFLRGDGTWSTPTNTTYGTVSTSANGLAPKVTSTSGFLKGDGTWATPTNTTYAVATTVANGLMSSSDKTKLDGIETGANNYSLPVATSAVFGGVKTGSNITNTSGTISLTKGNVTDALGYTPPTTNTTYGTMSGATSAAAGKSGLVPAPASGKQSQFLRGDGTWSTPTNTTYGSATTASEGLVKAAYVSDTTLVIF